MATFTGTSSSETLTGTSSSDTFTPLGGTDTIQGGDGTDTIVLQGNREDYLITRVGTHFVINDQVSGRDETNYVYDVETFQFSDVTIYSQTELSKSWLSDFNGDGRSDFYWRSNSATNSQDQIWYIPEGTTSASVATTLGSFTAGQQVIDTSVMEFASNSTSSTAYDGSGQMDYVVLYQSTSGLAFRTSTGSFTFSETSVGIDMNSGVRSYLGHGDSNNDTLQDLFVRNESAGTIEIYMGGNRTSLAGSGTLGSLESTWVTQGIGDMNGDGTSDMLFKNSVTGDIVQWNLTGNSVSSSAYLGNPGTTWDVIGFHDFDASGTDDILFRNSSTGDVVQWATSSSGISGSAMGNIGSNWTLLGAADFNGDGREDLLWKNSETNMVVNWLMNGSTSTGHLLSNAISSTMDFAGFGDYDGSGKVDIAWRDTSTNEVSVWFMDGSAFTSATVGSADVNSLTLAS